MLQNVPGREQVALFKLPAKGEEHLLLRVLVAPAPRQAGDDLFRLPAVENASHADHSSCSVHVGEDGVQPVSGGDEKLAEPVLLSGEHEAQARGVPRERAEPPGLAAGNEGRMEGALLCDSGKPVGIVPVGLAPLHPLDFAGVDDDDVEACLQKCVVWGHPVHAGALHEHDFNGQGPEELDELPETLFGKGVELAAHELALRAVLAGNNGGHDGKGLVDVYPCCPGVHVNDCFCHDAKPPRLWKSGCLLP